MLSRSQTVSDVGPCDDEGFVWKRGKWLGSWKKRYFMRKGTQLFSFEADDTTKPISGARTTFELEYWRLEKVNEKTEKRPHMCKLIHTNNKQSYIISFLDCSINLIAMPSEAELIKWLAAVNRTRVWLKYKRFVPQIVTIQSQYRMRQQCIPYKKLKQAAESFQYYYRLQCQKAKYKATIARVVKCQSVVRRFICKRAYKRQQRRKRIVNELVMTETTFVGNLRTILELFANPLKVAAQSPLSQILPPEEIKVLFGPLEPVYKINDEFCGILDKRLKSWSVAQKIGDQFILAADKFKFVYVPYILNYGEVCVILEKIRKKNQKFCDFLEAAAEDSRSRGLDISSFLIQPVQRLPRYELLLKDLIKHTPKNHVDFEDLNKGLQKINDVAIFINEKKRDKETISLVSTLQGQLEGKLAETINWKPHHRLLREGEGQSTTGRKVNYIFLISEFLILAQKQKTSYHVRELISLRDIEVNVLKNDGTEQINFQKNGEKAGVIVPLTKNAWSDDILLLVVSYQHQNKDRRNSVLLKSSTTSTSSSSLSLSSNSSADGSPVSPLSSPATSHVSPISPRGPSSSVPPIPLLSATPSFSLAPSPRGANTSSPRGNASSPRGPTSPSSPSPSSPSPSPSAPSPTPISPRNLSSHSSPNHNPLPKNNSNTQTNSKPGGSSLKLSLPSFPRSRSEKNVNVGAH